jgi:hypothetical protein
MSYNYPLTLPATPNAVSSSFGLRRAVAVAQSPFTGSQQVHEYDYALWKAQITLPPMKRETAGLWQAFFTKLRGRRGTFLMGDPDSKVPMGSIAGSGAATLHDAVSIGAYEITIDTALTSGESTAFKAGDYIQLGSGNGSRLYLICENTATGTTGRVDVHIEPSIKFAHSANETVVHQNPVGVWRMDTNELGWEANHMSVYGLTFSCTESM